MTVILTLVGIVVCLVSCFTANFKTGVKRLWAFALTGLVLDVLIWTAAATVIYMSNR